MGFEVRLLTAEDYPVLVTWWKYQKFPVPPKEYLPEEGIGGLMVTKDGVNVGAGFIYFTNSKIVWIEFMVRSHEYRGKDVHDALEYLLDKLCYVAKKKGFKAAFSSLKNTNLIKIHEKVGFVKDRHSTTEMTIIL